VEHRAQLGTQFGRVGVFMNRHGMLDGGIQEFLIGVRGQGDAAVHFAGKLATVDVFAGHGVIPQLRSMELGDKEQPGRRHSLSNK
jgi:hypothetical protein